MITKPNFIQRWCDSSGFSMYPIEREFMQNLVENTPDYRLALEKDLSPQFYADGKERLTGRIANSWKNEFIGKPGSGKSYSALYVYVLEQETMGSDVSIEKDFAFDKSNLQSKLSVKIREATGTDIETFLDSGKIIRIKTTMNLDEDTIPHGSGSQVENDVQLNIEKTTRQAQINFNFCTPTLQKHIYDCIIRIFAINFDRNQTIGFLMNPDTLKPIGVVLFGLPSDVTIGKYEREKQKYLFKAGKGEFGGNRDVLISDIAQQLLDENYDYENIRKLYGFGTLDECTNTKAIEMLIEKVAAGRLSIKEQKYVYVAIAAKNPEYDFSRKRKTKEDDDDEE